MSPATRLRKIPEATSKAKRREPAGWGLVVEESVTKVSRLARAESLARLCRFEDIVLALDVWKRIGKVWREVTLPAEVVECGVSGGRGETMRERTWNRWEWVISAVAFVLALMLCGVAQGQGTDFSKVQIKVTKVSGNIYMLEGEGGNIAASVGEDGIVIVDDQFAPLADKIQAALKDLKVTDKPVRFVINTHYHGDHTGGNEPFANTGSTVIAQDNVRKRLETGGTAGNGGSMKMEMKAAPKAALPVITFEHDVTVHLNGEDIRALHFPAGHTDGDAVIFFPKNNVVHMGDDFVRYGFPFIDVASGGSVQGMIDAMEKASAQLPADVKVIPGHGALSNLDDVREFVKMLKETSAAVQKALNEHKTLEQMKQEKILEPWKKWAGGFIDSDKFIETLYNSLTGSKGQFLKHN
jgi:cyclase